MQPLSILFYPGRQLLAARSRLEALPWPPVVFPLWRSPFRLGLFRSEALYPLNCGERLEPFFVLGAGRSGSTLLRRILQAQPQLHMPPENHVLAVMTRRFRRHCDARWDSLVSLMLDTFARQPSFADWQIDLRPVALQLSALPGKQRSLAAIVDRVYRYHGEVSGRQIERWGDKTPMNAQWPDLIPLVFPDARFIFMVRDGVDVVSSYVSADMQTLESAAAIWRTRTRSANSFWRRHRDTCIKVHYEVLVRQPSDEVARICHFLGIPFEMEMLTTLAHVGQLADVQRHDHYANVLKPINADSIGKGRRRLSRPQLQQVQRLIGADLARHGYAPALAAH